MTKNSISIILEGFFETLSDSDCVLRKNVYTIASKNKQEMMNIITSMRVFLSLFIIGSSTNKRNIGMTTGSAE
jgi:hypothetical protein